ncbi:MAG TPA: aminoglycoside phosphotransferase family protein [Chloroflexia bacterium]|nr:aminoglycoside phosphotransferase family protein [Chloroflexia bacterium]
MDLSSLQYHTDTLEPGTPEVALLRRDAASLLVQLDHKENLQTEKVLPLKAGMWNALFHLEPAGLVAKLSPYSNQFETNFLRVAEKQQVKVPRVISEGALEHPDLPGAAYFLMTYIPECINPYPLLVSGKLAGKVRLQLADDLGSELAKLHRHHLGYITHFGQPVKSWKEAITHPLFSPNWDEIVPKGFYQGELLKKFQHILQESGYLDFTDGSLCHTDLSLNNVLVHENSLELQAIIDPAGFAGMPMFDLAYTAMPWEIGFDFMDRLINSYQRQGGKLDPVYFKISLMVIAYQHVRFHTAAVKAAILEVIHEICL